MDISSYSIDSVDKSRFFMKRVENRKTETLTRVLDGAIKVLNKYHRDGYPLYPGVAENLWLKHKVVDHSKGFKSLDRTHTNII